MDKKERKSVERLLNSLKDEVGLKLAKLPMLLACLAMW